MVSFFGLKFGADKRKKRADSPAPLPQQWNQFDEYIGRRESFLKSSSSNGVITRPRTSQGTPHRPNRGLHHQHHHHHHHQPGGETTPQQVVDAADFKGIRAVLLGTTAAVPAGTGPVLSPTLKSYSSDSNLRVGSLGTRNLSSTSLNVMPRPPPSPRRPTGASSEIGGPQRPATAHSMRGSGDRIPPSPLNLPKTLSKTTSRQDDASSFSSSSPSSPVQHDSESSLRERETVRNKAGSPKPTLHIDLPMITNNTNKLTTSPFGNTTPKSPLGQYELASPVKSETDSLLGDDPGRIVDEIAARITREGPNPPKPLPKQQPLPLSEETRRLLEAELAEQKSKLDAARKKLEVARLRMAYPSPPASVESEQDDIPGPCSGERAGRLGGGAAGGGGSSSSIRLVTDDTTPEPGSTSDWASWGTDATLSTSSLPMIEAPSSAKAPSRGAVPEGANGGGRKQSTTSTTTDAQLSPYCATATSTVAGANPPRSPLFQQMSPFDIHSDEDEDEEEHMRVDHRATNAPYGLPSPPLSHRQRPSQEEDDDKQKQKQKQEEDHGDKVEEGLPVLRTVQAKRDTTLVGGPGAQRTSLGLQIDEFEKSLQQAQAMSALEWNGLETGKQHDSPSITISSSHDLLLTVTRNRANSNASSAYSDLSDAEESPVIVEPPLISPKPFPLSPRPMGPRTSTPAEDDVEDAPRSLFRQQTAINNIMPLRHQPTQEERPATPAGRPPPRLGAVKPTSQRPILNGCGPFKPTTTISPRRGTKPLARHTDASPSSPFPSPSPSVTTSSLYDIDSPILKTVRHANSIGGSPGPDSTSTSCTTSPIVAGVASYSVFSPPPPIKRPSAPATTLAPTRSATAGIKSEWFGPAPSAPPTSPLPVPDNARTPPPPLTPQPPPRTLSPATPSLRTSPSIVPDTTTNPNWPLPGPSPRLLLSIATEPATTTATGFMARRSSLHHNNNNNNNNNNNHHRRTGAPPPPPINIMATRYAEEVGGGGGGAGGPWTPAEEVVVASATTTTPRRPKTAGEMISGGGGGGGGGGNGAGSGCEGFEIRADFSRWKDDEPAQCQPQAQDQDQQHHENVLLSAGIGLARGPSIKYDKIRERERRARTHDKMKRMAIVSLDEEEEEEEKEEEDGEVVVVENGDEVLPALGLVSPTTTTTTTTTTTMPMTPTSEPFDRVRRPNHGLKSPMGFADEQGVHFI